MSIHFITQIQKHHISILLNTHCFVDGHIFTQDNCQVFVMIFLHLFFGESGGWGVTTQYSPSPLHAYLARSPTRDSNLPCKIIGSSAQNLKQMQFPTIMMNNYLHYMSSYSWVALLLLHVQLANFQLYLFRESFKYGICEKRHMTCKKYHKCQILKYKEGWLELVFEGNFTNYICMYLHNASSM